MKHTRFSALACAFCALFLPAAFGNHRTGSLALPEVIAVGDFNGDGNLDLAVNVTGFDNAAIFLGDGKGAFDLIGHYKLDTLPKGLDAADMNKDGNTDLVSCTAWGYTAQLLLGDGKGGFTPANQVKGDGEPVRLRLRDINTDGNLDIVMNAPDEGKIIIYFGDGKGGFALPPTEIEGYLHPFGLAVADVNNDNKLDIVTTTRTGVNPGTAHIAALLGDGMGGFTQSDFVPVTSKPSSVQITDLNGDNKPDLVVGGAEPHNTEGNFLATYLGDGAGHFTLKQNIPLGAGNLKGEIAVGDFDEDGNPDVAYPNTGIETGSHSTSIFIYFGDGTGKLVAGPTVTVGQEPHSVVAADFNKDGHLDLVDTDRTDGTISIALGDGKGHFTVVHTYSVISAALNP